MEFLLGDADYWLIENAMCLEQLVSIYYYGRSGSVFLQSLLDSHPQVLMVPGTVLMFYADFWKRYSHLSQDALIEKFCGYFASFFDVHADVKMGEWKQPSIVLSFNKMGENRDEVVSINKDKFLQALKLIFEKNELTSKSLFQAVHVAYTIALGRAGNLDRKNLPLIAHEAHLPGYYDGVMLLAKDFPSFKIIQMVREPLQTLGSHVKWQWKDYLPSSYGDAFPLVSNEAIVVRLEDLHTEPESTLKKLAQWLNIDWNDVLLQSTFDGKKWWNVQGVEQVTGFNQVTISKNHDDIYFPMDKYRLKILYGKRYVLWRYASKKPPLWKTLTLLPLLMLPFKIEFIIFKQLYRENKLSGLNYGLFVWWRKRRMYFKAWRYALSSKIKEPRCL